MRPNRSAVAGLLLAVAGQAWAHRLDEYLQATTISLEKRMISVDVRLTPGVAVFPAVMAQVDKDADGRITEHERQAYATRVLGDLSFTVDGERLQFRLASAQFAKLEDMREGRGEIQFLFEAAVRAGGPRRVLTFENHHQTAIAAYLVNSLVPRDPDIHITAQHRNYEQSSYRLEYTQAGVATSAMSPFWLAGVAGMLAVARIALARRQHRKSH